MMNPRIFGTYINFLFIIIRELRLDDTKFSLAASASLVQIGSAAVQFRWPRRRLDAVSNKP